MGIPLESRAGHGRSLRDDRLDRCPAAIDFPETVANVTTRRVV